MPDKESTDLGRLGPQSLFAALRYRNFRLFWTGLFVSNVGSWMQITAINWLLYELTNSPLQLGLNGLFRAVPTICFGLLGGTVIDRYDRKRLLLFTQATFMLLAFILGLLAQTGMIQVWHIYGLTLVSAIVGTLDGPARQALYPSLVPRAALPNAIALNSLLWKGTVLLGPSLAGITISTMGTAGAFYANALSFLSVIAALFLMKTPSYRVGPRGEFLKELNEGLWHVFSQKVILGVMAMEATSSIFGLDQAMLTIFARDILQAGASGLGFLQSARGLGAIVGSGILIFMSETQSHGKILFVSALLYGAGFALFGLSHTFILSLLLLLVVGATDTVWGAARNTILQLKTTETMRGRVMGIFQLSNRGLNPLGQVETGLMVPLVGAREATFIGGVIVVAITLFTAWRVPGLLRFQWEEETTTTKVFDLASPGES
jgi:MFS family permease